MPIAGFVLSIVAFLALAGFAFYVMTPEERVRALRPFVRPLEAATRAVARLLAGARWLIVGLFSGNPWAVTGGVMTVVLVLNLHAAKPDWSLPDFTPEIEKLMALEEQTARAYDAAVEQFKRGALSTEALATVIKKSLIPELQETTVRLQGLERIRADHQVLLDQAREYLRLRHESWRLRAEALDRRSLAELKVAEDVERISLSVLARVRRDERR